MKSKGGGGGGGGRGGSRRGGPPRGERRSPAGRRGFGGRPAEGKRFGERAEGRPSHRAARPPETPAAPSAPPPGARLVNVETVEVEIEKLIAGGEGLARWQGVPLFVPRSAPGDRLLARIVERRPDYGRAEIVEILAPGPGRRPDPVPELADWGGCDLQHIEDDLQPRLKAAAVRETLERLGRIELPGEPALITGDPWHYRLRTQLHTEVRDGAVAVGYHRRGSNELIPAARCPILVPELEDLLPRLPQLLAGSESLPSLPHRIDLAAGDGGAVTCAPVVEGLPHGEVSLTFGELTYAYDARCFFQAHRGLLPRLVEAAVGEWQGEEAFDLYAGVGLFTLALAQRYGRVTAVEGDRIAARYARTNARRNRLTNVEVVPQALETWVRQLPAQPDRLLVDPPRAGLSGPVRKAVLACHPARLTYVSCHPATLARDLRSLREVYAVESVTLLDLFPQTGHMETVVQLQVR